MVPGLGGSWAGWFLSWVAELGRIFGWLEKQELSDPGLSGQAELGRVQGQKEENSD